MEVAAFLKAKRGRAGLSVRQLAKKADISFTYISKLELGQRSPTFEVLARLLKALGVGWVEFLKTTGYITTPQRAKKVQASGFKRQKTTVKGIKKKTG